MKYLFFDIDGTLAVGVPGQGQYIPESTREALRRLREAGHFLSIATGRAHAMAVGYMRDLGFENMVSDGGYGVTIGGRLERLRPLPREKCLALIDECTAKELAWAVQTDDSDTRLAPDDRFYELTHDTYMATKTIPGLDAHTFPDIYKIYIAARSDAELDCLSSLNALPWCRYHATYIFVEPADKAWGIREMVAQTGGDTKDVIVFGDGVNDLSMFVPEWTSVAMGNAAEALKRRATFITADAADGGIYKACERLGLFERRN